MQQTDSLTVTQTARHLGVHRRSVDRLVFRGRLHRDASTGYIARREVLAESTARAEADYQIMRERLIQRLMAQVKQNIEKSTSASWWDQTETFR